MKTQLQKMNKKYFNVLNHALFILKFLNVNDYGQSAEYRFWHDGTTVTFTKAKWKDLCSGLWKGLAPIVIWGQGHENESWCLCTFCVVYRTEECQPWWHCEGQGPPSGGLYWDCWTCVFNLQCHHYTIWEWKEIMVMVGDFQHPDRTYYINIHSSVCPIYFGAGPRMLIEFLGMYLQNILGCRS